MKQFLLPESWKPGNQGISGPDFHYLVRVRRVKLNQRIACRTRDGQMVLCIVSSLYSDKIELTPVDDQGNIKGPDSMFDPAVSTRPAGSATRLHLLQGIPKGKKLDLIVRQAVEIGVTSIRPISCTNSIPDLSERWEAKKKRLNAIIREAFQQSGSLALSRLEDPVTIAEWIRSNNLSADSLGIVLYERELAQSAIHEYLGREFSDIFVLVGPEGGLSAEELQMLTEAGFKAVFLGRQILRTETAAIVGLGAISVILRERAIWKLEPGYKS